MPGPWGYQNYVGPPPVRPELPRDVKPTHILHLLLTIITAGFWVLVWIVVTANMAANNRARRARYRAGLAAWEIAYVEWQHRYHAVYGAPPPPAV